MLDNGYEVDLTGLSDSYVMQKLNKVCKLLKLKRSPDNKLEFKKVEKIQELQLKAMIQHFIDDTLASEKKQSESESDRSRSRSRSNSRSRSGRSKSSSSDSGSESGDSCEESDDDKAHKNIHKEEQKKEDKV